MTMNDDIETRDEPERRPEAEISTGTTLVHSGRGTPRPETLSILPMRETVLFPELVMPVVLDRPGPMAGAQHAMRNEQPVGLLLATPDDNGDDNDDSPESRLHRVGTGANIMRYVTGSDGNHHLVCQGISRFRVREFFKDEEGRLSAKVIWIEEPAPEGDKHVDARMDNLRNSALEAIELMDQPSRELAHAIRSITSAALLADAVAGYLGLKAKDKQQILEAIELEARLVLVGGRAHHSGSPSIVGPRISIGSTPARSQTASSGESPARSRASNAATSCGALVLIQ